jgi:hypothetical protein
MRGLNSLLHCKVTARGEEGDWALRLVTARLEEKRETGL